MNWSDFNDNYTATPSTREGNVKKYFIKRHRGNTVGEIYLNKSPFTIKRAKKEYYEQYIASSNTEQAKNFRIAQAKAKAVFKQRDTKARAVFKQWDTIRQGDTIEFQTHSGGERFKGIVENKDVLGLITIVNGVQYELRKLIIRVLKKGALGRKAEADQKRLAEAEAEALELELQLLEL